MASEPKPGGDDFDLQEREFLRERGGSAAAGCPPPDLLRAARADAVPEDLRVALERHLEGCRICQMLDRDLESLGDSIGAEERKRIDARVYGEFREARRRRRWWVWTLVPAAVVATVVLLLLWTHIPARNSAENVSPRAPAATSTVFAVEPARINVPIPLVMRGSSRTSQAYLDDLMAALAPYRVGHYAQAVHKLQRLVQKYPRSAEAPFYLGVSQLLEGQNSSARESLERVLTLAEGPLRAEATWYLALTYVRAGQNPRAAALLEGLCRSPNEYQSRACTGLKELSSAGAHAVPR